MTYELILSAIAAIFCLGISVFIFIKDRYSFIHLTFVIGMMALTVESVLNAISFQSFLPYEIIKWQRIRLMISAFIPGIWFLFSLGFARTNYKELVLKWRWIIFVIFFIPFILITFLNNYFFKEIYFQTDLSEWLIYLGWSGYLLSIYLLISSALILMNLERIIRASSGSIRWQIKFLILGVGAIFAAKIYTNSQILLLHSINITLETINIFIIIAANILIVWSFIRSRWLNVNIYLSESFLYNSVIILLIGIYLLAIGVLTKVLTYINLPQSFLLETLILFLACLSITVIIFSNQVRENVKKFIHFHFKRPLYDYRSIWTSFTQRINTLLGIKETCNTITKMVSEIFNVSGVTIWLVDEVQKGLILGGSTIFSNNQLKNHISTGDEAKEFINLMRNLQLAVDFKRSQNGLVGKFSESHLDYLLEGRIRYGVSLLAGGEFLGIITLNDKLTKEPFSYEELGLLKTIADQAAASIFNIIMSEKLRTIKEMEAIQTMSSFFIHDLKNLASKLSITMQNLPIHFENPEFRKDAFKTMSESLSKINHMCSNLSLLRKPVSLLTAKVDFNELIISTLKSLNGCKASIKQDFNPLPKFYGDPEQIQKVITNLLLNANEAVGDGGEIRISTEQKDSWILLSVMDNGCGMSKEFIENSLFHPFKTTKKDGMGIGLYHSKMIVEAHKGRIEVESEEGKGSTFRVFLPVAGK